MSDKGTNDRRSFWLFGHPFEARSTLSRDKAKAALRKQKLGWLDPKVGPRGWMLGSFLCLQWSALGQRGGAVVLARIADDELGCRVHGRAGFDLGSLSLIGVIAGVLIFSMCAFVLQMRNFAPIFLFNALVLLIVGAVLWLRLRFPEDADPLVRFIRRVLEKPAVRSIEVAPSHFDRMPLQSAKMNVDGKDLGAPPSEYDVAQTIISMKPDSFLIIDFGSNAFMQTTLEFDRFILEKCAGSDHELCRAKGDFEGNEIIAVMTAYLRGSQPSKQIIWETVRG